MAWMVGAAILNAAANVGAGLLTRPRKRDYKPNLEYLDKYVANLRGDLAKRSVERNILREAGTQIGDIARTQSEQTEYQTQRSGITGSGIQLRQQQAIGEQAQRSMATVSGEAMKIGAENQARAEESIRQVEMERERISTQAKEDYQRAKSQWGREMIGRGIQGAASIGGAAISSAMEWKDATAVAQAGMPEETYRIPGLATGIVRDFAVSPTPEMARKALQDTGASTPQAALQALGLSQDKKQGRNFVEQLAKFANVTPFIYNSSLTPQQNAQLLQTNENYQTNMAMSDFIDEVVSDPLMERDAMLDKVSGLNLDYSGKMRVLKDAMAIQQELQEPEPTIDWKGIEAQIEAAIATGNYGMANLNAQREGMSAEMQRRLQGSIEARELKAERGIAKAEAEAQANRKSRESFRKFKTNFGFLKDISPEQKELAGKIENFAYDGREENKVELISKVDQWLKSVTDRQLAKSTGIFGYLLQKAGGLEGVNLEGLTPALQRVRLLDLLTKDLVSKDINFEGLPESKQFKQGVSEW